MAETCSSDPTGAAVLTTQESVKSESRHTLSVLQSNDDRSSLVVTIHDRPLGSVISKLDAKSIRESQRFVDERLAITHVRSVTLWQTHRTSKNKYADQIGRKNHERFRLGDKVLLGTKTLSKHAVSVLPGGTFKLLP